MASPANAVGNWIRRFHHSPQRVARLVCFPHAGGSASYYFPLSRALAPHIEILAVQYPGRQDRHGEECVDNIAGLAEGAVDALSPWTRIPFAFFGHSMGAIVAFEVARRLPPAGMGPRQLFASGQCAPCRTRDDRVHLRDDAGIVAELRGTGGTAREVLAETGLLAAILPAARADFTAIENYRYEPGAPLDCPITAMVGESDSRATVDEAAAWASHTTAGFDLRRYPGGHFYLDSQRPAVIETIRTTLRQASPEAV